MKILSPLTGKQMEIIKKKQTVVYKNRKITYNSIALECKDTGEMFTNTQIDEVNYDNMIKAWERSLK